MGIEKRINHPLEPLLFGGPCIELVNEAHVAVENGIFRSKAGVPVGTFPSDGAATPCLPVRLTRNIETAPTA